MECFAKIVAKPSILDPCYASGYSVKVLEAIETCQSTGCYWNMPKVIGVYWNMPKVLEVIETCQITEPIK